MGEKRSLRRRALGLAAVFLAMGYARLVWAHVTALPHHRQDIADLATGRDKRGVIVLITVAFVVVMTSLVAFLIRQTKTEKPAEDMRSGQERLRRNVMHAAATARPLFGRPTEELMARTVQAYAHIAHRPPPSRVGTESSQTFRFGDDLVTVDYTRGGTASSFRIRAATNVAGAEVTVFADGRSSIAVFAVPDDADFLATAE